jgi:ligand-binding sensor domain-containing protein
MKKLLVTLILFCSLSVIAFADTWQVFTSSNGLNDNNVNCFAAMKTYMAVGTNCGANIYNGETASWYTLKLPDQVASHPIKDIAFDKNGHLWVASARGLVHIQGKELNLYGVEDGLPTVDVDKIQIRESKINVGCFGGYICSAVVPLNGRSAFTPVNYRREEVDTSFKMRSVGISGLGILNPAKGWYSTQGEGLIEQIGPNAYPINGVDGMPESWVNDFWVFQGPSRNTHIISITPEHISLVRNNQTLQEVRLPAEDVWLNCIIAVKEPPEVYTCIELPDMNDEEKSFFKFLDKRSLFIGTRSHGLWRYQKGHWTNINSLDNNLPSNCINRLYLMGRTLVICTTGGLVLISLDSNQYDEFKNQGIGNIYAKTIFPFPELFQYMIPFRQICKGTSFWFSHMHGLSRWRSRTQPRIRERDVNTDLSSRLEVLKDETEEKLNFHDDPEGLESLPEPDIDVEEIFSPALSGFWQLFSKQYIVDDQTSDTSINSVELQENFLFDIYSENITSMTVDPSTDFLWVIFDKKHLYRLRMVKGIVEKNGKKMKKEKPEWLNMAKYHPWAGGQQLNVVWFNDSKLYIGSEEDGFYILKNPQSTDMENAPYEWAHYGIYERLVSSDCIGFARWNSTLGDNLVILHKKSISLWDGEDFTQLGTGAEREYTCIDAGSDGNLWIGSWGGLFRFTPQALMRSYTSTDAWFESNYITAVAALPPKTHRDTGVWVACDKEASFTSLSDNFNGSDQPPNVYTMPDGKKVVKELDIDGSSFHFFDGRTWEKWKMAGIKYIYVDGDFVWTTSNIRVRRLLAPR